MLKREQEQGQTAHARNDFAHPTLPRSLNLFCSADAGVLNMWRIAFKLRARPRKEVLQCYHYPPLLQPCLFQLLCAQDPSHPTTGQ